MGDTDYHVATCPVRAEEGGRDLIEFPDLPGRMSDRETIEQAVVNRAEDKRYWIEAIRDAGRMVTSPKEDAAKA